MTETEALTVNDKRVLATLREASSGAYKLTKRTRLSSRAVRESLARLEALDLIHVADTGPHGGRFYAATEDTHTLERTTP